MTTATAGALITEGCLLAGRTEYETLALGWLNRWLDSVAASWEWPQLREEVVGYRLRTEVGVGSYQFGKGTVATTVDGPTTRVIEIYDNITMYLADGSYKARLPITSYMRDNTDTVDFDNATPAAPSSIHIRRPGQSNSSDSGYFRMWTNVPVDREYLLVVPYRKIPAAVTTANYPWFPDDETVVQAVAYKCLEYGDGKDSSKTIKAQQDLAVLLSAQRVRHASETTNGDKLQLSRRTFRHRGH